MASLHLNPIELVIIAMFTTLHTVFYFVFGVDHVRTQLYFTMCGFLGSSLPLYRCGRATAWVSLVLTWIVTLLARNDRQGYSPASVLTETQALVGLTLVIVEGLGKCCLDCDRRVTWMDEARLPCPTVQAAVPPRNASCHPCSHASAGGA